MNPDTRVCRRCIDAVEFRALARGFDGVEPAFLGMSPRWVRCAQHPFIEPAARKIIAINAALLNSGQVGSPSVHQMVARRERGRRNSEADASRLTEFVSGKPGRTCWRLISRSPTIIGTAPIRCGLAVSALAAKNRSPPPMPGCCRSLRTTTVRALAVRKLRAVRRQRLSGSIVVSRRRHDRQERRSRLCRY
jgi:plasmid stabilization system protein ParE